MVLVVSGCGVGSVVGGIGGGDSYGVGVGGDGSRWRAFKWVVEDQIL